MDIVKALNDEILKIPRKDESQFIPDVIFETLTKYKLLINEIEQGLYISEFKELRPAILALCDAMVEAINLYYKGLIAKAFNVFEKGIDAIESLNTGKTIFKDGFLFRAREGSNKEYSLSEMFHLPFNMRNYSSAQRFSVPGFPCLYLSNSIYVCWEELRRPEINLMQVSRLESTQEYFELLDISMTSDFVLNLLEAPKRHDYENEDNSYLLRKILNYFAFWPVAMACSLKVNDGKAPFKPEYIFPQFLLQYVIQKAKFDGIKYLSVEANSHFENRLPTPMGHSSYVIPVRDTIYPDGHCSILKKNFKITEPISWELLHIINPIMSENQEDLLKYFKRNPFSIFPLELVKGRLSNYSKTIFGKLEIELMKREALSLT